MFAPLVLPVGLCLLILNFLHALQRLCNFPLRLQSLYHLWNIDEAAVRLDLTKGINLETISPNLFHNVELHLARKFR